MEPAPAEVTQILQAHVAGDRRAQDRLLSLIYDDLKALAANAMKGERPDHTLQPTMLVHDAFLRLVEHDHIDWQDRAHFFALAATTLRRILVDHARAKQAKKRGGEASRVPLSDRFTVESLDPVELLAINEAVEKLGRMHERLARIVDVRFFAGLTIEETAHVLGVSQSTVKTDWKFARAWLDMELAPGREA